MATVSIRIPAFNGARYISETIASVLSQTCEDFEVIVVDDCSGDGTRRLKVAEEPSLLFWIAVPPIRFTVAEDPSDRCMPFRPLLRKTEERLVQIFPRESSLAQLLQQGTLENANVITTERFS